MKSTTLLHLESLNSDLQKAIRSSMYDLTSGASPGNLWAQNSLRQKVEDSIAAKSLNMLNTTNSLPTNPPGSGFQVTFGLQIALSYKIRVKANVGFGYGLRNNNFAGTTTVHFSAYNGGLGVPVSRRNLVVDVSAAANLTIGSGFSTPLQSYALNYNSPIPMQNNFQRSFSYGQLFTWNSALNQNNFSLETIQREGLVGFRLGDVNVSSSNDTKRFPYFGGGTDKGWTGQLSIVTPLAEVGFQDFSGDFLRPDQGGELERKREILVERIKAVKKNALLSKGEKNFQIKILEDEMKKLTFHNFHTQTPYQKSLNKASTYLRFNRGSGFSTTLDFIGPAWLQNGIHRTIKDFRFEYDYRNIQLWGGKNW